MQRYLPVLLAVLVPTVAPRSVLAADEPARDSLPAIAQDAIDLQNDLSAILETVKTKEDLEKVREKIGKVRLAAERLRVRTEKLISDPDPDKMLAKLAAVSEKNAAAAAAAQKRYQAAVGKLSAEAREELTADLSGAGGYDRLMQDALKMLNETADVVEGIKTKEDVDKQKPQLERLADKAKGMEAAAKKLGQPKPEEMEKLMEKYMPRITAASQRLQKATSKLPPDVREALQKLMPKGF